MRRIFPGTSAVVAVGLLAAAAGCSGTTSTIGHAAWVKAVDAVCTRADAQAQRTTSAAAFGQVRTGEARALAALHPARVADVSAQREISDQMRTSGKIDALAHPTSADRVQAVDAEAGFTFGSLAAKLTPCAVDPALASGSSQSARDSLAAASAIAGCATTATR